MINENDPAADLPVRQLCEGNLMNIYRNERV